MIMRQSSLYIIFIIMTFLASLSLAETKPAPISDDTKPIMVNANDPYVTIRLKSNPTTGYRWFIRSYPHAFIVPQQHSVEKQTSNLMGAPTQEVFTFKLNRIAFTAPHHFIIRFSYLRPFEASGKIDGRTFRITTGDENNHTSRTKHNSRS